MKYIVLSIFFFLSAPSLHAQFYYLDILVNKQTNNQYKLLRNFEIRKITATSYDGDEISEDFVLEQTISGDGKQIITRTASVNNEESYFISNYNINRIIHTVDSSKNAINTVDYTYDNSGKILNIDNNSKDFDGTFLNTENHIWYYKDNGLPLNMLKIRNGADTTYVTFDYDENGNVAEEKWQKKNNTIETYYYYYNDKKILTDVVRYNARAQKLLPDFMFEYDNLGHLTQMTQTQGGIANYLVWKYFYNENGLKDKELVYNKNRLLLGRVEYRYR